MTHRVGVCDISLQMTERFLYSPFFIR